MDISTIDNQSVMAEFSRMDGSLFSVNRWPLKSEEAMRGIARGAAQGQSLAGTGTVQLRV